MIDLYPAIDLLDGRCVRLHQGDYHRETRYSADPVQVAEGFAGMGARWIHVVDLDAARTGQPVNRAVVAAIVDAVAAAGVRVQCGGGVRSDDAAAALADIGVGRVVVGTAAIEDPAFLRRTASRQATAIGLDARHGEVRSHGWVQGSDVTVSEVLARVADARLDAVILTEIGRDGTLAGPDLVGLRRALGDTAVPVIASGGIGSLDDVAALASLRNGERALAGAIVGKALYEGRFDVAQALAVLGG